MSNIQLYQLYNSDNYSITSVIHRVESEQGSCTAVGMPLHLGARKSVPDHVIGTEGWLPSHPLVRFMATVLQPSFRSIPPAL